MKILVTCGPAFEPIDAVRRITNFATGEIGTLLSNALAHAGHEVHCYRGSACSALAPDSSVQVRRFTTNVSLLEALREQSEDGSVGAVFHAAALSDFVVESIESGGSDENKIVGCGKISSATERLLLRLKPAAKVVGFFREFFPQAFLVAWKYEVEGDLARATAAAEAQMKHYDTDACVLNGPASGQGFHLFLKNRGRVRSVSDKVELAEVLVGEIEKRS
ncbi:MAG: phosphopantothenoylcysteine decarboxylase [Chthoniobacterales bacterium]